MLRPASSTDLPEITTLLGTAELPVAGVAAHLETFVVFESSDCVVAVGGLELHGSLALVRSLSVAPAYRGRGLATAICEHLELQAVRRGVEHLYLLTETAEIFFSKRGYVVTPRSEAPPEIASSDEFSLICPQSAVLMRRAA